MLTSGPWMVIGHYLAVQNWKPEFHASKGKVTNIVAWVRFPDLPLDYFVKKGAPKNCKSPRNSH